MTDTFPTPSPTWSSTASPQRGRRGTLPHSGLDISTPANGLNPYDLAGRTGTKQLLFCQTPLDNIQHSTTSFVNLTLNNSWQANWIFFSWRNEGKCKWFQYCWGKQNEKQIAPGHLIPKPIAASVSFFVKCWNYKWTDLAGKRGPGRNQLRRPSRV